MCSQCIFIRKVYSIWNVNAVKYYIAQHSPKNERISSSRFWEKPSEKLRKKRHNNFSCYKLKFDKTFLLAFVRIKFSRGFFFRHISSSYKTHETLESVKQKSISMTLSSLAMENRNLIIDSTPGVMRSSRWKLLESYSVSR